MGPFFVLGSFGNLFVVLRYDYDISLLLVRRAFNRELQGAERRQLGDLILRHDHIHKSINNVPFIGGRALPTKWRLPVKANGGANQVYVLP